MSSFSYGLGLLILLFGFSVAWLAVAVFVSNEMAGLMGLLVILFWFAVFMPVLVVREAMWRAKQGALIRKYREMKEQGGLVGDGSGTSVMMVDATQHTSHLPQMAMQQDYAPWAGQEVDPYKRPHEGQFARGLILLAAGCIMLIGASSITVREWIYSVAEMIQPPAINWEQVIAEDEDDARILRAAARVALFRESSCGRIMSGHVVSSPERLFEFVCAGVPVTAGGLGSYTAWVMPQELERKGLGALFSFFKAAPRQADAEQACHQAVIDLFNSRGLKMQLAADGVGAAHVAPLVMKANYPYNDYMRLFLVSRLLTAEGQKATVRSNCWVDGEGSASVRLLKPPVK